MLSFPLELRICRACQVNVTTWCSMEVFFKSNTRSVSDFSPNLEQDVLLCLHRLASFVLELKIATTLVTTAAAESVLTTLHSLVSRTRPPSMESGNYHFVLRKAVAVKVSGR